MIGSLSTNSIDGSDHGTETILGSGIDSALSIRMFSLFSIFLCYYGVEILEADNMA